MEIIITAGWLRVYDDCGQDFAAWTYDQLTPDMVMEVIGAVHEQDRDRIEALRDRR